MKRSDVYPPVLLQTLNTLALVEAWSGNLRAARLHGMRASAVAARSGLLHHPAVLEARVALARVCRERGNQRRAAELIGDAEADSAVGGHPGVAGIFAVERARWLLAEGLATEGLALLECYRATTEVSPPPLIEAHLRAAEATLLVSLDELDRADSIVASTPGTSFCSELAAVGVQTAVARRDLDVAAARVDQWAPDDAQRRHRLEHDLWAAVVASEAGDRRLAIEILSGVVAAAEQEGDVRVFLDGGRPVERALRTIVHASSLPYAHRLLDLARQSHDPARAGVGLSRRELEVTRYLPTPLSSAEIAERLYISLNTLKTHLRTIYGKLGATSRREAIQRAEELGIA
ncbi:MAG: hypothetical protein JO265_02365 [Acidimicrobiia bacterium]|nr:hypothetical protein [Acidimicrobiia bacterium]